ncbi:hypothetical protein J4Q44_G00123250 [Coregonus suidteri]|uniref:Cadherin domain-containing protein n=1 Tax=Coregonus suidteri TaxID=861788 RepID=A0AAN8QUC4_9TELE
MLTTTPQCFSPALFEVAFAEENQPGDKVVDVVATDADSGTNAELVYSIVADTSTRGLFEIDPVSGEVRARSPLDREHKERYEFRVTASDKGSPSHRGTATVVVKVLDRNDNDPKFMLSGYSFSVLENMPPLSAVGMVTVLDMDQGENARVQLSVDPDGGKFVIQNGTGTILSSISFDREKESSYTFRLKAVDGGEPPRSSYVGVTINVLDENDNDPVVTKPSNSSFRLLSPLAAPDSRVELVEAEDLDTGPNAELVFSITGGNPYELFSISSTTGEITLAKELTQKHGGLHRLVVRVSDEGKPARHATAMVHIYVNETIAMSAWWKRWWDTVSTPLWRQTSLVTQTTAWRPSARETKSGYQAGKKETKDLYAPKQGPKNGKGKRGRKGKPSKAPKPLGEEEEVSLQKSLKFNLDGLQAQSPSASQKHQAVQDLPATNTFVGTGGDDKLNRLRPVLGL